MRHALVRWFESKGIRPRIRGEFQDSALLLVFGRAGDGIFAAPSLIAEEIIAQHRLAVVAELHGVSERFYAVTAERKIDHPGVRAIAEGARKQLVRT